MWNTGWVRNALSRFSSDGQRLARADLDVGIGQLAAEGAPHRLDDLRRGGLVHRDAERAVADPQIDLFRRARGRRFRSALRRRRTVTVSKNASLRRRKAELAQVRPPAPRRGDAPCVRYASALPGRDRPRTSRRSPPAAPARCRCWRSPFRGGYAARGSAAPADRPARPRRSTDRPTMRPGSERFSASRTAI